MLKLEYVVAVGLLIPPEFHSIVYCLLSAALALRDPVQHIMVGCLAGRNNFYFSSGYNKKDYLEPQNYFLPQAATTRRDGTGK
jgi:hypothetical protein